MKNRVRVEYVEGPAFLAPALINNDISGMDHNDMVEMYVFLNMLPYGYHIVSTIGCEYMGRFNGLMMNICKYVIHCNNDK